MSDSATAIRRARPSEAPELTALALRSKAHWGYDADFMRAATPAMTIPTELIDGSSCHVAERDAAVVGFYVLSVEEGAPTLRDLWVEPAAIGTGVGAALFHHMRGEARRLGYAVVRIESDPHAEPFYVKMGARRVGAVESRVFAGRMLPVMQFEI